MQRARAYLLSPHPLDTPLSGREDIGCNCFSSGEAVHTECIMPQAHRSMLGFFQLVADVPGYQEIEAMQLPPAEDGDRDGNGDGGNGPVGPAPAAAGGFVVDYRDGREVTMG